MSFWKRLFDKKVKSKNTDEADLSELGVKTIKELENIVKLLIRSTTKINVQKASRLPKTLN